MVRQAGRFCFTSALALWFTVAVVLVSCAKVTPTPTPAPTPVAIPTPTPAPKPEGILRIGNPYVSENFDPMHSVASDKPTMELWADTLVGMTGDGEELSTNTGLAHRWETSPDLLTWTFYLRKGVQFHEGWGEVTAEDVKFSLDRVIFDPASKASHIEALRKSVREVEVVDPYTVKFHLKQPYLGIAYDLSSMLGNVGRIVPKKYIEKVGAKQFNEKAIGSGPYRVKKYTPGYEIVFEALDEHPMLGIPRFKEVVLRSVPEQSTRVAMLKRGELDVISIDTETASEVERAGFKVFEQAEATKAAVRYYRMWEGYLSDVRVRRALSLAINRDELAKTLFKGKARPASGEIYFGSWTLGVSFPPADPYDPAQAKMLLAAAGYPDGFELAFYSYPRAAVPELPLMNEAVAEYWKKVGVKVKLLPIDYGAFQKIELTPEVKNTVSGHSGANRVFASSVMASSRYSKSKRAVIRDPKLDALIEKLVAAETLEEYSKAQAAVGDYSADNYFALSIATISIFKAANPEKVTKWNVGGKQIFSMGLRELVSRGK